MLQTLIKRLEIIRAAMSLADEDLIAQQLPALRAVLPQLDGAADETLAAIIAALAGGHYPQAMRLINRFLTAQAALVVSEDAELVALRLELAALERQITAETLERDEIQTLLERFNRDFLLHCGPTLTEILTAQEQIARLQLEKALHAQRGQRQEKRDAGHQEEAETDYRSEMDEEEVARAEAEDEEQAEIAAESADEWEETLAAYDAWCDWLEGQEALANAAAEDDPDLENARRTYEETKQQREAFSNEQTQAEIEQQDIAALDADAETRLKAAYRRASQLCHPDRVSAEHKTQAEQLFKELGQAYKKKDLPTVERILAQLQRGIFTAASDTLSDTAALHARIAELRENLAALRAEIATLQDDDTYTLLRGFADEAAYQAYLAEQCAILAGELEQLYTLLRSLTEEEADDAGGVADTADDDDDETFFF